MKTIQCKRKHTVESSEEQPKNSRPLCGLCIIEDYKEGKLTPELAKDNFYMLKTYGTFITPTK